MGRAGRFAWPPQVAAPVQHRFSTGSARGRHAALWLRLVPGNLRVELAPKEPAGGLGAAEALVLLSVQLAGPVGRRVWGVRHAQYRGRGGHAALSQDWQPGQRSPSSSSQLAAVLGQRMR